MMTGPTSERSTIRVGSRTYPVLLPKLRDPRFKIAATIVSVHILGQVGLDFRLSIAQILAAVLTAMVLEIAVLFRRKGVFEWPASALLTGSGVALILRVVGTRHGDWWSMKGWYFFAGVSAVSVLSKYVIRPHGMQIFNPNNLGLTLGFVVLGSTLVEPLDFWWGPMSPALAAAVIIIMVGGIAVTSQVRMLFMTVTFWITFATFLGMLAASGHCFSARWSLQPVCDGSFWWVTVTSPELLIFLFFMITDPKAIPRGNVGRFVLAVVVAMLAVLFMAPQQTEFGAKVALLGSLTVFSAVLKYVERSFPAAGSEGDHVGEWVRNVIPARGILVAGSVGVFVVAVLLVGGAARSPAAGSVLDIAVGERPEVQIDSASLPPVTISEEARQAYEEVSDSQAQSIALDLMIDLQIEAIALQTRDPALAATAAAGARLTNIEEQIASAGQDGVVVVPFYTFDSMEIVLSYTGSQSSPLLGVEVHGTVRQVTYGGSNGTMIGEVESSVESVFVVAETADGDYVIVNAVGGLAVNGVDAVSPTETTMIEFDTATIAPPLFVEEADAAGIEHAYEGGFEFFVGGGVAAFDCDGDRKPDLYLAGGENEAALYRNESPIAGALRFSRLSNPVTDLTQVTGAFPLDIDSDGHTDLAVLRFGENVLLRGLGDCHFERANEALAFDGGDVWTAGFSARWEGMESLPTLAFGNYVALSDTGQQDGTCSENELVRPDESTSGYAAPLALEPGWCALSILFSDWDRSGRGDLRMSNDRHYYSDGEEQLWRIEEGKPPSLYLREEGWKKMQIWGMGIASYDLTGDGYPEVFLTSMGDNKLQTLSDGAAQPTYEDIAILQGVTAHRPFTGTEILPSTAWHSEFQDVNNDSFVDLYVAKGNVEAMLESAAEDPNNLLLGLPDGTFVEGAQAAGILNTERTRGAALVDFNLDGMLDLIEMNRRENIKLWRNVGRGTADQPSAMGDWIAIQLDQPSPNSDGVGSWIEVRIGDRTLSREVTVGGGHAGGQLGWIHFGLGQARSAEVRVQWPGGEVGPWIEVASNQFAIIERGSSNEQVWTPSQN